MTMDELRSKLRSLGWIDEAEELRLSSIKPHDRIPLWFSFRYIPGHPRSEDFKVWFEQHDVAYTVFEQNYDGAEQDACVDFTHHPDLAVLFKLRFG